HRPPPVPHSFPTRRSSDLELAADRRAQVGSGERAEKIRTYNFPEQRVTDHRIDLKVHNLPAVLDGDLDELTEALQADDKARRLQDRKSTRLNSSHDQISYA